MWKKLERTMEKWGHYLLALLCAGVVLLSAVWTRSLPPEPAGDQLALSDQSERLSRPSEPSGKAPWIRPAAGPVAQGYSLSPVYFPETRLWQAHPGVDFEAPAGTKIRAMAAGTVLACGKDSVRLKHGDGLESLYRGLSVVRALPGQKMAAGAVLGEAGARIPGEGEGRVCVTLYDHGQPISFEEAMAE